MGLMRGLSIACVALATGCFGALELDEYKLEEPPDAGTRDASAMDDGDGDGDGDQAGDDGPMVCVGPDNSEICKVGIGTCQRVAPWNCSGDEPVCDAQPGQPRDEICRSDADEDCDGETDEAPEGKCCDDSDCNGPQVCQLTEATRLSGGRCVEPNTTDCAADLETDDLHCGACGNACEADESCVDGTCEPNPPACGGADLQTDDNNCGTCGKQCEPHETCNTGTCICPGNPDVQTDDKHCGTCGNVCGADESCVDGTCEPAPPKCGDGVVDSDLGEQCDPGGQVLGCSNCRITGYYAQCSELGPATAGICYSFGISGGGVARPMLLPDKCTSDSSCPQVPGATWRATCEPGSGLCSLQCSTDEDCPAAYTCFGGSICWVE